MRAILSAVLLAACASASPVKTTQLMSVVPIDARLAFETAIETVQQRYAVVSVDSAHGTFATAPIHVDASGSVIVYVVRFAGLRLPPGAAHVMTRGGLPVLGNSLAGLRTHGMLAVEVTPVALAGATILPPDHLPRAARDEADDLVREIHFREQENRVVF
jgi:hypothetical protein